MGPFVTTKLETGPERKVLHKPGRYCEGGKFLFWRLEDGRRV